VAAPDAGAGQWYPTLAASSNGAVITWVRQFEMGSTVAVAVVDRLRDTKEVPAAVVQVPHTIVEAVS
jgi:hypothetical protein